MRVNSESYRWHNSLRTGVTGISPFEWHVTLKGRIYFNTHNHNSSTVHDNGGNDSINAAISLPVSVLVSSHERMQADSILGFGGQRSGFRGPVAWRPGVENIVIKKSKQERNSRIAACKTRLLCTCPGSTAFLSKSPVITVSLYLFIPPTKDSC